MKKSLLWLVVSIMSIALLWMFTLAGCKEEVAEEVAEEVEEAAEEVQEEVEEVEEPITLSMWDVQASPVYKTMVEEIFALYQESHPNVSFDRKGLSYDESRELLKSAALAGNLPDFYTLSSAEIREWYDEGHVLNLKPYLDADPEWESKLLYPVDSPAVSLDNGNIVCALGSQAWHMYMIYFKDMHEQYNLEEPTTVDAIVRNNEILEANGITSFATGVQSPSQFSDIWVCFVAMIDGNRDRISQAELGEISWQNETFITAAEAIKKLEPCFADDALSVDEFTDGHTRLYSKEYWGGIYYYEQMFSELTEALPEDVENGNVILAPWPLPTPDSDPEVQEGGVGTDFIVNANSPHIDACIEFYKFWHSTEVTKILVKNSLPPAVKIDFDLGEVVEDPLFLQALEIVNEHPKQYQNAFFYNADAQAKLRENLTNMFIGNITPEQVFEDMDSNFYEK